LGTIVTRREADNGDVEPEALPSRALGLDVVGRGLAADEGAEHGIAVMVAVGVPGGIEPAQDVVAGLADDLLGGVAKDAAGLVAPVADAIVLVDDEDAVACATQGLQEGVGVC